MRSRGKKFIAIAVVLVLVFVLMLGACGNDGDGRLPASSGGGASVASGDDILIGYVTAFTGPLSGFSAATEWANSVCIGVINDEFGGIEIDGERRKIRVIYGDSESDPVKASEIAQKLVLEDGVDILVGAGGLANIGPVSAAGEHHGIPTYVLNSQADSWIESGGSYHWSIGTLFYLEDMLSDVVGALSRLDTNKKVGFVFDSEIDGVIISSMLKPMLEEAEFTIFDPGRFPAELSDYTRLIGQIQAEDCDIVVANMTNPQFANAWGQFHENNYIPKAFNIGRAISSQADAEALGEDMAHGLISEAFWDRSFPFTSTLLGMSADALASAWEEENGTQFPATLGYDVSLWEVLYDALTRARTLSPDAVRSAILATSIDSIYGHLSFDENQVARVPCVAVQWHRGETWPYEKAVASSVSRPEIRTGPIFAMPDTTQ